VASEGEVRASVSGDKRSATIVEVNIQTDFASRNDAFKTFVGEVLAIAEKAAAGADLSKESLHGKTVADVATELTAKIGEKSPPPPGSRRGPAGKQGARAYVHMGGRSRHPVVGTSAPRRRRPDHQVRRRTAMQIAA
jgi:elongation factor Ts